MPVDRRLFLHLLGSAALAPAAQASSFDGFALPGRSSLLDENARPGTRDWIPQRTSRAREIEAYASATSLGRGDSISFFVDTASPRWSAEVFRLGWYGGEGARRVLSGIEREGKRQPAPEIDPATGLIECRWTDPWTFPVPQNDDWPSGVYLAKFTSEDGWEWVVPFTVRDDRRRSAFLFQSSVTTWQAYNDWGGKSLYAGDPQARVVSFDRPYAQGGGAGELFRWEIDMIRFLEREGYDVRYCTNVDLHADSVLLAGTEAFLSVGHDEYWSWEMREQVAGAIADGTGVGFFSGNDCYWQIRFAPSQNGVPNRRIVAWKEAALEQDPFALDGNPANDHLITTKWRNAPVSRPEDALIGVMYQSGNYGVDADIVVENTGHWAFRGTGLRDGDRLPGLLGYEVDEMSGNAPGGLVRLGHSPFPNAYGGTRWSDMTIYEAPSGAVVFAAGSIQWAWGLDDFAPPTGARVSVAAQQVTRNILARLAARPGPRRRPVRR